MMKQSHTLTAPWNIEHVHVCFCKYDQAVMLVFWAVFNGIMKCLAYMQVVSVITRCVIAASVCSLKHEMRQIVTVVTK